MRVHFFASFSKRLGRRSYFVAGLCDNRRQLLSELEFLLNDYHATQVFQGRLSLRHSKGECLQYFLNESVLCAILGVSACMRNKAVFFIFFQIACVK
jgi:hypothetical protein